MPKDNELMDMLAERVASGESLAVAGRKIGVSTFKCVALWARICARLGAQAV